MRIVTALDCGMTFDGGAAFAPGESILLGDWAAEQVEQRLTKRGSKVRNSSAEDYTCRPRPYDFKPGDRLISSRGLAVGDQLVWAGLLNLLHNLYPFLEIVHYCPPAMIELLFSGADNLPFTVKPDPIPFSDWRSAQWHLVGEGLNEDDFEPDQPNIWDGHFRAAGLHPALVHSSCRMPFLPSSAADHAAAEKIVRELSGEKLFVKSSPPEPSSQKLLQHGTGAIDDGTPPSNAPCSNVPVALAGGAGGARTAPPAVAPVILWHLAASTPIRTYPPMLTRQAIYGLLQAGCRVIAVGSKSQIKAFSPLPEGVIIPPADTPLRTLLVLCGYVDCVVCPDSCFGWAAAAAGAKCVSLWGAFGPDDRIGTGQTWHRPLIGRCPISPCRKHEKPWLKPGCPTTGGGCRALASIPPDAIVQAVKDLTHDPVP